MAPPMLWFEAKSSLKSNGLQNLGLDFDGASRPHGDMASPDPDDDRIALIIQLNTRIGMIMEDVVIVALDASPEGVVERVEAIADASGRIAALAEAIRVLNLDS